ncbi:MAG: polysaccharide lyase family 7 protein [Cocleimonas sp.]|nr:polysaccharide lyase family 7 protein [Cocleimonas sp.]
MKNSASPKSKSPLFIIISLILTFLTPITAYAYEAPYNVAGFRDVLNKTKLQFPNKKQIDFGSFRGVARANFYLTNGRYMTFKARKRHKEVIVRSELRFGPHGWKVNSNRSKLLKAEFALEKPRSIKQVTILQIHAENPSVPPLRVVWLKRHKSLNDHLWAIVRPSPYHKKIHYVDLGKRPNKGFTRVSVSVKNNLMKIWVNKRLRTIQSLKRWKGTINYYKAGTYLSGKKDIGLAIVYFRLLEHKV